MDYVNQHKELIDSCKAGKRQSQQQLYQLYAKGMYNVCLRMVGHPQDAEDVLQNAFVDVFTHLEAFRYESSIGAWIKRIVVNHSINHLKKKKMLLEELQEKHYDHSDVQEDDAATTTLSIPSILRAIEQLSDGYRTVFSLYSLEGYDHDEIAEILGISEQTSKSQYHRAKLRLKQLLGGKYPSLD